ncbi:MAG: prepilin-type N-terminal cleavage/methylation domain-containing protein, partial [Pseudomonadota bacterium]
KEGNNMLSRLAKAIKRGFRGIGKRGYTLLEVAAVVAVTGTLAAVAMPVVADKIAASKVTAATQDVQAIKDSIVNFMKDTGVPPFYTTAAGSLPKTSDVTNMSPIIVTKDGIVPSIDGSATAWETIPTATTATVETVDGQIIDNAPKYPTLGTNAWKGPYVPSLKKDPWGNKYVVVVQWLGEPVAETTGGKKYQRAAYVISAGPNGLIETSYSQKIRVIEGDQEVTPVVGNFVVGNDDIVSRIN